MKRQKVRSKMGVKEKALTAASSIASGDFLRMVTSAGASRKIDYSKLAKAIVEEYNGSTIAGSAQTLKAALDSLNSKTPASLDAIESGSANDFVTECRAVVNFVKVSDGPRSDGWYFLEVKNYSWGAGAISVQQIASQTGGANIYIRFCSNNTWTPWRSFQLT